LSYTAEFGWQMMTRALLDGGADVNLKDHNGVTPLMYAVRHDQESEIENFAGKELLGCATIDVDAVDSSGCTALVYAASQQRSAATRAILGAKGTVVEGHLDFDQILVGERERIQQAQKTKGGTLGEIEQSSESRIKTEGRLTICITLH
jgi:hypothetical protein